MNFVKLKDDKGNIARINLDLISVYGDVKNYDPHYRGTALSYIITAGLPAAATPYLVTASVLELDRMTGAKTVLV